mmetsp:Transcript_8099/g.31914  ORF Transcript_8099/g.31914 Transcript_8099/m.31914 type:complete len:255 (+) Transcript_8099:136-900(+)
MQAWGRHRQRPVPALGALAGHRGHLALASAPAPQQRGEGERRCCGEARVCHCRPGAGAGRGLQERELGGWLAAALGPRHAGSEGPAARGQEAEWLGGVCANVELHDPAAEGDCREEGQPGAAAGLANTSKGNAQVPAAAVDVANVAPLEVKDAADGELSQTAGAVRVGSEEIRLGSVRPLLGLLGRSGKELSAARAPGPGRRVIADAHALVDVRDDGRRRPPDLNGRLARGALRVHRGLKVPAVAEAVRCRQLG